MMRPLYTLAKAIGFSAMAMALAFSAVLFMAQIPGGSLPSFRSTVNRSVVIGTGGTFQTILAATVLRFSLTIENNNPLSGTEYCYIFIGAGSATTATSILLGPGGSYQRYWPFIPSDAIQATCTTTSDTIYLDTQ